MRMVIEAKIVENVSNKAVTRKTVGVGGETPTPFGLEPSLLRALSF